MVEKPKELRGERKASKKRKAGGWGKGMGGSQE